MTGVQTCALPIYNLLLYRHEDSVLGLLINFEYSEELDVVDVVDGHEEHVIEDCDASMNKAADLWEPEAINEAADLEESEAINEAADLEECEAINKAADLKEREAINEAADLEEREASIDETEIDGIRTVCSHSKNVQFERW